MIYVAARATNGVKIDNLRNTREGILYEFKHNVTALSGSAQAVNEGSARWVSRPEPP